MKRILSLGPSSGSIQLWTHSSRWKRARRTFARDSSGARDPSGKMALCSSPMSPRTFFIGGRLDRQAEVFLEPSGGILADPDFVEPGSNGLALDPNGRLLLCQSGGRRVVRLEADGHTETVLADRFEGRRFNNPNDLVCHSSGAIYFSDPSYGFKGHEASPLREMPWNGVYRIAPDGPGRFAQHGLFISQRPGIQSRRENALHCRQ